MPKPDRRSKNAALGGEDTQTLIEQIRRLAYWDSLTGLLNRRGFDEELRLLWSQGERHAFPLGLLILDIDPYKAINDSHGHFAGDQVLKECAQLVRSSVRDSDVVCRYCGGDEMVVILPQAEMDETRKIAERMIETFRSTVICPGTYGLRITISVGACHIANASDSTPDQFLVQADQALSCAKQAGRDRVCHANELPELAEPRENDGMAPASADRADSRRGVLVVDDDRASCMAFERILPLDRFHVWIAGTGADAAKILERERDMIDVALVDLHLIEESGLEVLKQLRGIDESVIGVILTGQATVDDAVESFRQGAYDFVQKPVAPAQLTAVLERAIQHRRLLQENQRDQLHLENMVREKNAALSRALDEANATRQFVVEAISDILEVREQKTGEHSRRVASISAVLAREMGCSPEDIQTIETGALLHDIGKIGIPDAILLKPGPLTEVEREIMKKHPHVGYNLIKAGPGLEEASKTVLEHQERYDGSGYPGKLRGENICLGARIFAVADTYDAIRTDRPYSKGRSADAALDEIRRHKGTLFDPSAVEALCRCHAEIERVGRWPDP